MINKMNKEVVSFLKKEDKNLAIKLKMKRQIKLLEAMARKNSVDSSSVVGAILALWCSQNYPKLPLNKIKFPKKLLREVLIMDFVNLLSSLDILEASYWLSSTYAILSNADYRKKLAMYFTPVSITEGLLNDLVEQGVDFAAQSFIDPACGGAAFLAPIAFRMKKILHARGLSDLEILVHIEENIFGADLDSSLCELSRQFLCMTVYEEIKNSGYFPEFKIHKANSLSDLAKFHGSMDVVVCNPPYRKMGSIELNPLREEYMDVFEAQPNLYGLFIGLAVKLLKYGGRAALVTPTSFLSGQNFSKLREFLIANSNIEHIGMVSDRMGVFIDVEQETALTVLKRREKADARVTNAKVSVVSKSGLYTDVGSSRLPPGGAIWPIPRSIDDVPLLKLMSRSKFRFEHYGYRARIGAFVWNRDLRPTYESAEDVKHSQCRTAVPLLWSSDIRLNGDVNFGEVACNPGEHRFVDFGSFQHSSIIKRPSVVLQRVTSNTQARRLVAAEVPQKIFEDYGGFVGENHIVVLESLMEEPVISSRELALMISVDVIDRCFRCISGATNVSVFELGELPLPDPLLVKKYTKNGFSMRDAVYCSYGF